MAVQIWAAFLLINNDAIKLQNLSVFTQSIGC